MKWITFCAVTNRAMRFDLNQAEFLAAGAVKEGTPDERFRKALKLAKDYFEVERFEEFVDKHLGHIDEAFAEFHATGAMDAIIAREIEVSRFPEHEHQKFFEEYSEKVARSVREGLS